MRKSWHLTTICCYWLAHHCLCFCHCSCSVKFCTFTKRRQRLLYYLHLFKIQVWFGFNMLYAVTLSTTSTRKIKLTRWAKRHTFHPFSTFPNKEICLCNIPGISDSTFLVIVDHVNYYCHLSQCTLWSNKPTTNIQGIIG